jgi:enoyl-CoA hydratase
MRAGMGTIRQEDLAGGVCRLTLDHPPANAINEELLRDLGRALDDIRGSAAVRAVVLTGASAFFSGGFDFAAPRRDDAGAGAVYALYREVHLKLLTLPAPTLAMLNGHATAGGLVLVLACDYRLGLAGDYRVGLNEVAVGAAFPRAAYEIVKLRVPHGRASELMLGAALYPASEAVRLGIVDELFPAERFEATVLKRAARLAAFPREAYAHAKALLVADAVRAIASETDAEARQTMAVWLAPESRAARAAQRAKLGVRGSP